MGTTVLNIGKSFIVEKHTQILLRREIIMLRFWLCCVLVSCVIIFFVIIFGKIILWVVGGLIIFLLICVAVVCGVLSCFSARYYDYYEKMFEEKDL